MSRCDTADHGASHPTPSPALSLKRKSELMLMLQCDYYPDGCLWVVRCRSCLTPVPPGRAAIIVRFMLLESPRGTKGERRSR